MFLPQAIAAIAASLLGASWGRRAAFHPDAVDRSVLALNALLGLGTALAPVFVAIFVSLGFWWGLPLVLVVAFVLIALLPTGRPALGILAFGLAGLGCSTLLPLTISFGQEELTAISASVAGGVIALYQGGYGIAAFGVGPLEDAGVDLSTLFGLTAIVAAALGALSFAIAGRRPEPASLHPRPAA